MLSDKEIILDGWNRQNVCDELKIEFRKDFVLIGNLKTGKTKQLMWRFIYKEECTHTFTDENYGQWLISPNHITYTDFENGNNTSFVCRME